MQRVFLVPHDPLWAEEFARESAAIARSLADCVVAIHHIGSTAIPGLVAKPIVDMLVAVADVRMLDRRAGALEALGYEAMGEFGIPGRRYFRKDNRGGDRTHQIHAFQADSPQITRHLAFRDFLRAHPAEAEAYAALKHRLAGAHPENISAYTDGKSAFIQMIEAKAAAWLAAAASDV